METLNQYQDYMRRALQLAERGIFHTAPNPMVGCVIVHQNRIIGQGYHRQCGQPHAEVNAIASVQDKELLPQSTLFVTLEPCSHYGKTPPCADLIISKGIKQVVVGMVDPNPLVAGKGIQKLRNAGINVQVGILEQECRKLNKRFLTVQEKQRPYVILKWAQSADGYIDLLRQEKGNGPVRISNDITKTTNHHMRACEGAIMVATKTALLDNPHLTTRKWAGPNPLRVLLDRTLKVPADFDIFNSESQTLVFNQIKEETKQNIEFKIIDFTQPIVPQILHELYKRKINSVIVEGGAQLLKAFIDSDLWDECQIETAPIQLMQGIEAPTIKGTFLGSETIEQNVMSHWKNNNNQYL